MADTNSSLKNQYNENTNDTKILKTICLITAFALIFMICFIISYKFAVDSSNKNTEIADIPPGERIPVYIPLGSSTYDIAKLLEKEGIIKHPLLFRILSNINGYDGTYKSGTHMVSKKLGYVDIMKILASNPQGVKVTIPEGYTVKQIAQKLADEKLVDVDKFMDAVNNGEFKFKFVEDIPKRENRLEGYLFPDTYEFDLKAGENEIIRRMLANFDVKFPTKYYEQANKLGLTADQVIILASIVEKEAKVPDERPRIASVFLNRLSGKYNVTKKLESCATIQYIYAQKYNTIKTKITDADTKIDDPYNTYQHEGLPPGPICNPGSASIEAVLNPENTPYLYFVAKGDGTHYFSKTLEEHLSAMRRYGVN